ncbi:hypothetical protein ACFL6S_35685 [Candidatus Poribacteria bacterium]
MIGIPYVFIILALSQTTAMVEAEEIVATCASPNNGAGPFWCYGAPLVLRWGDDVFVSAMETGEDVEPLCNTRWRLFKKHGDGDWEMVHADDDFRQREPCPLVSFSNGQVFLSVNPSTQPPGTKYGPCDPHLLEFSASEPEKTGVPVRPIWEEGTYFTDHSYRGVASDGVQGEILLLNMHARGGEQYWSFRNASGEWTRHGLIQFPIRSCYPQVALKNGAGHVLAIGDIVEPVEEWRTYKFEQSGRSWDYVFRRLFYTHTPDITKTDFVEPVEIDELEATSGHITNLDLWIDGEGAAHILYLKRSVQSAKMRDQFFPDVPLTTSLEYVVVQDSDVVKRSTLFKGGEGASSEVPGYARFHVAADGSLFVVYYSSGSDADGNRISENKLLRIGDDKPVSIPLEEPFRMFFTATERGGSAPSDIIDLFGPGRDQALRYARVSLR